MMNRPLTLEALDEMRLDEAQSLPREARERLLHLVLDDARKLLGPQIERQAGLFCDYFEEDLTRLLKLHAVRVRCSGFIPIDERGDVPSPVPAVQFQRVFDNVSRAMVRMGTSLDRVVNCIVFLRRMELWAEMNSVYRAYFRCPPTRATIGTSGLNRGYEIEVANVVAFKLAR
jgi:2-iminobutanoate/2-iminopropanoate deaminase